VAFAAADRATVDKFHRAAVQAGGRDNSAPGLRPHYHAAYYAAFVIDPDGNKVEAVFHGDRQLPAVTLACASVLSLELLKAFHVVALLGS
jgi:hypothetical protein